MKQNKNGLFIPSEQKMTYTIEDFAPLAPHELHQNITAPISQALAQGVPPEQAAAIPLEIMARLIRTVHNIAHTLNHTTEEVTALINDADTPKELADKLRRLPIFPEPIIEDILNDTP